MNTVLDLYVPPFVSITHISDKKTGDAEYVVTNEATGKFFLANTASVTFLDALNRSRNMQEALRLAGIDHQNGKTLLEQMLRYGVVVDRGATQLVQAPQAPLESKAISMRFDLINAASLTRRLEWFGRLAFSVPGVVLWGVLLVLMIYFLAVNGEKARFAMSQIPTAGWADVIRFVVLIVALKVVHEMGHALAYRVMCKREGHDPGPIRMGIAIFAMTPFPFTDVTGAWRLRSRARRAIIGAAGIYFELGATALLTIFWAQTIAGDLQVTIFQVAIFTAATTILFNFNPAVKLDGYYVLSDLMGQHNIAGRGSFAARHWFARKLGAEVSRPETPYLLYWLFSYCYRWILFAGIFWIFYRIDQRLAGPVALIILLTLIGRPLMASLTFARSTGAKSMNMILAGGLVFAAIAASLIPFPDRILMEGRLATHDTRFVYAVDAAKVALNVDDVTGPQISLDNPELAYQARDLALRRNILDNTARSVTGSATEKTQLANDSASLSQISDTLSERIDRLQVVANTDEIWDLRAVERYDGAWIAPNSGRPLAVLSRPAPVRVLVWLDQAKVEQGLFDASTLTVAVRVAADPACQFDAEVPIKDSGLTAQEQVFKLTAFPLGDAPQCLTAYDNGAAVVARLDTQPKSVFARGHRTIRRLLQNRLPGQNQNIQG